MAIHPYKLNGVLRNDFMYWNCCSQTQSKGTITIKDDQKTYAKIEKTNRSANLQDLQKGSAFYLGGPNLRVEINIPESKDIDVSQISNNITDKSGNIVGTVVCLCYEDWVDKDYNDFYLNIVAWRKMG